MPHLISPGRIAKAMSYLDSKPTILQIIPKLDSGGAEKTTLDIARAITTTGWHSIVVSEGGRMTSELERNGSTHMLLPVASKNPFKIILNSLRLVALIRRLNISIVHARSRAPAWSALIATRYCKIPFVTTYHGAYKQSSWIKALYNSVMIRSNITIANSVWTASLIKSRYSSKKLNIQVIYRGTDFNNFDLNKIDPKRQQSLRDQWKINDLQPVILNLARVSALKGQRTFIETIPKIVKTHPDAIFIIAGDDSGHHGYRRELEQRCKELDVSRHVRFPGHCDEPTTAYSISNLTVVTSHQPETFGRVAVESQALKTLVVVTDLGGAGETVLAPPAVDKEQRTGWKIPPNDVQVLSDTILEILNTDQKTKKQIRNCARAHVVSKFSNKKMCAETIDIYRSLLD